MAPERWPEIERLYHAALERNAGERTAFLEQVCREDAALRREVQSLLDAGDDGYLETPALEVAAKALAQDQNSTPAHPGRAVLHYRILSRLGSGGMGDVFKALDTRLDRQVALKFLRVALAHDPQMLERFLREARTASALNHPNICSIFGIDEFHGEPFITMELLEGQSMRERIARGPVSIGELIDFGVQIADGLEAAHSRGIVHRDLKPGNLFLTAENRVKLLDFGLAKLLPGKLDQDGAASDRGLTLAGVPVGTVAYMSPEQARAEPMDARTDLFSFGAVLYELATGRPAFSGPTTAVIFHEILSGTPTPPSQLRPELPAKIEEIIAKALEKDRDLRYQHAADLRADLKRLKRERDSWPPATPHSVPPFPVTTPRPPGWHRMAWAALVLGLLAVVGGTAWKLRPRPAVVMPPGDVQPLNGLSGVALYPALRSDGSQVAFSWDGYEHKKPHIYVQSASAGGGEPLALTSGDASDISPVWNHDGSRIAFIRISQNADESGVYVAPSSGGREKLITPVQSLRPESLGRQLTWCSDGSMFIADRESESRPFRIFRVLPNGARAVLMTPPDGSLGDSDPTCSPDAAQLAFVRTAKSWSVKDVQVVALGGTSNRPLQLTNVHSGITGMAWLNSHELVFSSSHAGSPALWTADLEAGNISRVNASGNVMYPTTAAGILAFSQIAESSNIWALDHVDKPPAGTPYQLIASTGRDASPQISPDGRTLVFASSRVGTFEIWVADADGRNPMRLTSFNKNPGAGSPRWSPNGSRIAFDCRINQNTAIYLMNRTGGGLVKLTDSASEEAVPTWSRDGSAIYFTSNRSGDHQIWKMPANGGRPVQITWTGGFIGFEGPDGFLYYVKSRDSGSGIWRRALAGGGETIVVPGFQPLFWSFWALQPNGIYYINATGTNGELASALEFQSFSGRSTIIARLGNLRRIAFPGLAISSGGDRILYSQIDRRTAEIMMMRPYP